MRIARLTRIWQTWEWYDPAIHRSIEIIDDDFAGRINFASSTYITNETAPPPF
jgi:hypothetical protein